MKLAIRSQGYIAYPDREGSDLGEKWNNGWNKNITEPMRQLVMSS